MKLPNNYVLAQKALAECNSIDEIKDWTNEEEKRAAYDKQLSSIELEQHLYEIKERARRALYQMVQKAERIENIRSKPQENAERRNSFVREGTPTQTETFQDMGLKYWEVQAIRKAGNMSDEKFEAHIEKEKKEIKKKHEVKVINKEPEEIIDYVHELKQAKYSLKNLAIKLDKLKNDINGFAPYKAPYKDIVKANEVAGQLLIEVGELCMITERMAKGAKNG